MGRTLSCCWRRACGRARLARAGWRVTRRDLRGISVSTHQADMSGERDVSGRMLRSGNTMFTAGRPNQPPLTSGTLSNDEAVLAPSGTSHLPTFQQIWALFASEHSFSPSLTVSGHLDTSGGPPLGGRRKVVCRPLGSGKLTTLGVFRSRGLPPGFEASR